MLLSKLFQNIDSLTISDGFQDLDIKKIVTDSRDAIEGAMFVSLKGETQDGNAFIEDAVQRGARVVIAQCGVLFGNEDGNIAMIDHDDPGKILPILLNRFYDNPCQKISLIGITGTNGKTTGTYLIESIYRQAGKSCGVIGTINYRFAGKTFPAKNTTPGLADNFYYIDQMIKEGVDACVMEVSSHALVQGRVNGFCFQEAVFTNLTGDHLDYHHTQEEYFLAKAKFFDGSVDIKNAILNSDDPYGERLKNISVSSVATYGISKESDMKAEEIDLSLEGSKFILAASGEKVSVQTPLIGKHNIYNILAAASVCLKEGFSLDDIKGGIESLYVIPGRLERIEEVEDIFVFVDYAHTEDALKNVYLADALWTDDAKMMYDKWKLANPSDETKDSWWSDVLAFWDEARTEREANKTSLAAATDQDDLDAIVDRLDDSLINLGAEGLTGTTKKDTDTDTEDDFNRFFGGGQ